MKVLTTAAGQCDLTGLSVPEPHVSDPPRGPIIESEEIAMSETENRELPLTNVSSSGCACCAPADTENAQEPKLATEARIEPASATVRAEYQVAGMTCGHCSSSVSEALTGLDGVADVQVALVPGGISTVSIAGTRVVPDAEVREAVAEAGYELALS
jgi:copper chaperone